MCRHTVQGDNPSQRPTTTNELRARSPGGRMEATFSEACLSTLVPCHVNAAWTSLPSRRTTQRAQAAVRSEKPLTGTCQLASIRCFVASDGAIHSVTVTTCVVRSGRSSLNDELAPQATCSSANRLADNCPPTSIRCVPRWRARRPEFGRLTWLAQPACIAAQCALPRPAGRRTSTKCCMPGPRPWVRRDGQ